MLIAASDISSTITSNVETAFFACTPLFDPAGNQLGTPNLSAVAWDWEGQVGAASYPDPDDPSGSVSEYYVYARGGGMRVRKVRETVNAKGLVTKLAVTDYLGDLERRADYAQADPAISIGYDGETVSNAVAQKDYSELRVRLGHAQSARLLTGKLSAEGPRDESKSYFDLSNHVDSVQMELDESGAISSYQSYYPFGGTAAAAEAAGDIGMGLKRYQYSGQEKDNSGLYYYGYRYYDPSAFRWTRPDPAGLRGSGFNWYAMVSNNPVTHRDTMGLGWKELLISGYLRQHGILQCLAPIFMAYLSLEPRANKINWILNGIYIHHHSKNALVNRHKRWDVQSKTRLYDYNSKKADVYFIIFNLSFRKYASVIAQEMKSMKIVDDVYVELNETSFQKKYLYNLEKLQLKLMGFKPLERHQEVLSETLNEFCSRGVAARPRSYMDLSGHFRINLSKASIFDAIIKYAGDFHLENCRAWMGAALQMDDRLATHQSYSNRFMLTEIEHEIENSRKSVAVILDEVHIIRNTTDMQFEIKFPSQGKYVSYILLNDIYLDKQLEYTFKGRKNVKIRVILPDTTATANSGIYFGLPNHIRPFSLSGPYVFSTYGEEFFEMHTSGTVPQHLDIAASPNSGSNNENNPSNPARAQKGDSDDGYMNMDE